MAVQVIQALAIAKTCYDIAKDVKNGMDHIQSRDTNQDIDHGATFDAQMPDEPLRPVPGLTPMEHDRVLSVAASMSEAGDALEGQPTAPDLKNDLSGFSTF